MTMEVEVDTVKAEVSTPIDKDTILDYLTNNEEICFKSQQIGENDLTKQEKTDIAIEIYNKSKLNFLTRFGKYLQQDQLNFFQQFTENCDESYEISIVLKEYSETIKTKIQTSVRNRRYEALKQLIREDSYFSEIEMMKRNPLLYEQLIGQYLTEEEKIERDKIITIDEEKPTLVKILMEGIERDDAQAKRKQQQEDEDDQMEEEDEEEDAEDSDEFVTTKPNYVQWGEFVDETKEIKKTRKRQKKEYVTLKEQELLKEEFVSSMYQNFLDGKDEDFDYASVDNNDKYDNNEMKENDEEDKYFDSEEPETVTELPEPESEDELDIFMSALNQNPAVSQLSKDIQKL